MAVSKSKEMRCCCVSSFKLLSSFHPKWLWTAFVKAFLGNAEGSWLCVVIAWDLLQLQPLWEAGWPQETWFPTTTTLKSLGQRTRDWRSVLSQMFQSINKIDQNSCSSIKMENQWCICRSNILYARLVGCTCNSCWKSENLKCLLACNCVKI